jgi:3-oxoacyl-[acyl-carrier-protein] synthase II
MAAAMRIALDDAHLPVESIGFVNGHGTATEWGDIAESNATREVFGERISLHTLKGFLGHTLGACGAIEAWLGLAMMREGWFAPTANLVNIDERCAQLDYVIGEGRRLETEYLMSNNFAFGGINTSLIFKRLP